MLEVHHLGREIFDGDHNVELIAITHQLDPSAAGDVGLVKLRPKGRRHRVRQEIGCEYPAGIYPPVHSPTQ